MKTYQNYENEEIVFLSLTEEASSLQTTITAWATQFNIPWSVGYDAGDTLAALEVPGYPTTFVVGRDGKVLWHSFLPGSLDRAIRQAL